MDSGCANVRRENISHVVGRHLLDARGSQPRLAVEVLRIMEPQFIVQVFTHEGQVITVAFVRGALAARQRQAEVRQMVLAGEPIPVEGKGFSVNGADVAEVRVEPSSE